MTNVSPRIQNSLAWFPLGLVGDDALFVHEMLGQQGVSGSQVMESAANMSTSEVQVRVASGMLISKAKGIANRAHKGQTGRMGAWRGCAPRPPMRLGGLRPPDTRKAGLRLPRGQK